MDGSDPPPQKRQKREPSSSPLAIADIAPSSRVIDQKDTHGESDTFGWVSCSENSEAERLAIKEKAVEQAQGFCAKLYVMLQAAIEDIQAGSDDAVIMGQEIIKQWLSEHGEYLPTSEEVESLFTVLMCPQIKSVPNIATMECWLVSRAQPVLGSLHFWAHFFGSKNFYPLAKKELLRQLLGRSHGTMTTPQAMSTVQKSASERRLKLKESSLCYFWR